MMGTQSLFRSTKLINYKEATMKKLITCPVCGATEDKLTTSTGTETFNYKGASVVIEGYTVTTCSACGEGFVDPESRKRSVVILRDHQRALDGFLTSHEIKGIRKSLNKTQDELSVLLGGGEKAFARYENGTVLQSKAMDNLLRILQKCPESINLLGQATQILWPTSHIEIKSFPPLLDLPFHSTGNSVDYSFMLNSETIESHLQNSLHYNHFSENNPVYTPDSPYELEAA